MYDSTGCRCCPRRASGPWVWGLLSLLMGVAVFAPADGAPAASAGAAIDLPEFKPLWTRDGGAGEAVPDAAESRDGYPSLRVTHRGRHDWALTPAGAPVAVHAGEIYELSAWVKTTGPGEVGISAVTYDAGGKVVEWQYGSRAARRARDWALLRARLIVPAGVSSVQPRLTGSGPVTAWVGGMTLRSVGDVRALRSANLPAELAVRNTAISVRLRTGDGTMTVVDRRNNGTWSQGVAGGDLVVTDAKAADGGLTVSLLHVPTGLEVRATLRLDGDRPEFTVALAARGALPQAIEFPHPFVTGKGTYLVVPMNEGISYPVDDASIPAMHLIAYGGHGICMPFFGVTVGGAGQMAILETPDDAAIRIDRRRRGEGEAEALCVWPEWQGQRGEFGYERRVRYVFFAEGGHVAMAKRYRAYAREAGLLKTLAEKRRDVAAVDQLVGAANVWFFDRDPVGMAKELQAAGIGRILWSNRAEPATIRAMNDMGILTSRYDIYQDVMDPAQFPRLRYTHPDWTTAAWPKDLLRGADGDWVKGWEIEVKDSKSHEMIPCGVLCDRQALPYAEARIGEELKTHAYRSRFIDTTTASPWRECYDPGHPMTRTDSRAWKMKLLGLVSDSFHLVTGSETGHDAAVPYVHYFEGMLSLGPYRVPDAGRDMRRIWTEVPAAVAKFQVGEAYRLPLWELVYHDCVVAQWYWGDYNNKLPAVWDKRDLFNALYGTPPMFMFGRDAFRRDGARFVQSYNATAPVARATGYSEMVDHRFLAPDRHVQETVFANGVRVVANFGDVAFRLPDGNTVAPMAMRVTGLATTDNR